MDLRCVVFCGSGSKRVKPDVERRITDKCILTPRLTDVADCGDSNKQTKKKPSVISESQFLGAVDVFTQCPHDF